MLGIGLLWISSTARAEFVFSVYGGRSCVYDDDLDVQQDGGSSFTLHDANWRTKDFTPKIYYGARLMYFLDRQSPWGFGLEFLHSKIYLDTDDNVLVTGTRDGMPVNQVEPVSDTFSHLSCTHGMNYFTADVIYRFFLSKDEQKLIHRFQPYVGCGLGVTIPHVEYTSPDKSIHSEEYQLGGLGVQAIAGVSFDVAKHVQVFSEYKFTYSSLEDLEYPGGNVSFESMGHHWVFGISFRF